MSVPLVPQITVLSYKLYASPSSNVADTQQTEIGQVLSIDFSESRDVLPNFVIGNDPPDEASNLIPGVVKNRTITLKRVALYTEAMLQVFGQSNQDIIASLTDQSVPITLVATIFQAASPQPDLNSPSSSNPTAPTGKYKTISYNSGFLSDIKRTASMEGDVRILEDATFKYLNVTETPFA